MPQNTILTTQEVAKYLKLNEKTVLKMAQNGELPAVKIANQWRYYLSAIDEYLQDRIVKSSSYDFSKLVSASDLIPLSRLVEQEYICIDLASDNRDSLLQELADIAQDSGVANSSEDVFRQLQKREVMLSTAVGNGVAVPHPRNPSDELFKRPGVIIGRSEKGVDFSSPDHKKAHLFFMVCAPDVVLHLRILSKIAKLLEASDIFERFMKAGSKDEIMKILLESERLDLRTAKSL